MWRTNLLAVALTLPITLDRAAGQQPVIQPLTGVCGLPVACGDEVVGRVADLVVQVETGEITSAVVTIAKGNSEQGTRQLAVPFAALRWHARTSQLLLDLERRELAEFATFHPEKIEPTVAVGTDADDTEAATPASGEPRELPLVGSMRATQLAAVSLRFADGTTDAVRGLAIELATGTVAFTMVAHVERTPGEAELHAVPWQAGAMVGILASAEAHDAETPPQPVLVLDVDRTQLRRAPAKTEGVLTDPLYRDRIYAFFSVDRPQDEAGQ